MKHPNAATAIGTGWVLAAIIYVLGLFGVSIPDPPLEVALGLGGTASAVALFIGRRGFAGVWQVLKHGTGG